jgi:hypothetical protein
MRCHHNLLLDLVYCCEKKLHPLNPFFDVGSIGWMISAPHMKPAGRGLVPALKILNELLQTDKSVGIAPEIGPFFENKGSEVMRIEQFFRG